MCTHLIRRGGRYSIRRRVPSDLISVVGKQEFVRALGTADRAEAVRRCRLEGVRMDNEWAALRGESAAASVIAQPPAPRPAVPLSAQPVSKASKPAAKGHMLSKVIDAWARERQPQPRSVGIARKVAERFTTMVGALPVEAMTRQNCITFKTAMLEAGQTAVNTDKQMTVFSTLLQYACDQGWIDANPARGVKVGVRANAKAARLPFDLPALKLIFGSPIYTAGARPGAAAGEAAYWLPLLALYTGARLEELAQLAPGDVHEATYMDAGGTERSTWIIRISDIGEGQAVKTATSRRRVPVHPDLIALGFISYAQSINAPRLFPLLKIDTDGREGGLFGKWFGKHIRKLGISDRRMVFHSFRHLLKHTMRECGITEEVSDAITGHASGSVGRRYGATLYPLAPLVEAMYRYRIHGLTLPRRSAH
ncbi:MAG TPA: site-specific integrase [Paraburkholderia sp.]|uniref:site-specific integrase n=1 Tax=Paraburkholderia sp. TaxID=1926495 RepID=UPI002B4A82CA|nr:site-specific integrase [Paraburkholderia sp.]HKR44038.1 site-specific integrase [Paraburkholderia sp.]